MALERLTLLQWRRGESAALSGGLGMCAVRLARVSGRESKVIKEARRRGGGRERVERTEARVSRRVERETEREAHTHTIPTRASGREGEGKEGERGRGEEGTETGVENVVSRFLFRLLSSRSLFPLLHIHMHS